MNLLSAAMASALALPPAPAPVVAIQVTAVSTCDYLQIGIFNGSRATVRVVPQNAEQADPPFDVEPEHSDAINVPGHKDLVAGFKINNTRFGPWQYERPKDCDKNPAADARHPAVKADVAYRREPHDAWYYIGVIGLAMLLVGMVYLCFWHTRQLLAARRIQAELSTVGRHRASERPGLRARVKRRISRWFSRRGWTTRLDG
jgi:hypothetical protein